MNRQISRTASEIIRSFTEIKQQLELEHEHSKLQRVIEFTSNRRAERNKKFHLLPTVEVEKTGIADAIRSAEKYKNMDDHKIELADLYNRYETDPKIGLTTEKTIQRNQQFGDNVLPEAKTTAWYIKLLKELFAGFSILLWGGGALRFVGYALDPSDPSNLYLGIALLIVVILSGLLSYHENQKSDALMDSFKNFIPPKAKAIRDGVLTSVDAKKLVPGDIVEVKEGDKIPADIRIIHAQEMKVDNSSLTGETEALMRTIECTNKTNPLETANLAFFGTLCKEGSGKGVVLNIGASTIIGQIANLASHAEVLTSPLQREMHRFVKIIAVIAILTGIFFFSMGFAVGYNIVENFIYGIAVMCAYIPEGLLPCVVISLTLSAKKLVKKKVLIKKLECVETLGSTSCICSDKTGTLTQNKMTVQRMWYNGLTVRAENYQKKGPGAFFEYDKESVEFKALQEGAMVSSDAVFENSVPNRLLENLSTIKDERERNLALEKITADYQKSLTNMLWLERPVIGDASETALVKFYQPIEDIQVTRKKRPTRKMNDGSFTKVPFNSSWKYALNIVEYKTKDSESCIFIKGAPEKIWTFCDKLFINGEEEPITPQRQNDFKAVNRLFGNGGERVLGFAKLHLPKSKYPEDFQFKCGNPLEPNYPMKGFTFLGLISLIDPPKESVPYSINKCRTAGVKVIMVTGDQPLTAAAIAREVNIFGKTEKTVNDLMEEEHITFDEAFARSHALVIHGDQITESCTADLMLPEQEKGRMIRKWLSKPRIVFARTTPAQKLIIVKACQEQGHVVAVTGDGVNDSPAIKKADLGIAMGITGSDVAKDAASMILLTDDFSAIVLGMEEGRKIFDNLKKAILYCLTVNIPELVPFLTLILLGFPLPLSIVLILCVDIGYNILPSITFSSEEAEIDIMVRPPRQRSDHLVTKKLVSNAYLLNGVFQAFGSILTYLIIMNDFGFPPGSLFKLSVTDGFPPNVGDVYDPSAPYYGSTSVDFINYCNGCWNGGNCDSKTAGTERPDWTFTKYWKDDLRLWFLECRADGTIGTLIDFSECNMKQMSLQTDLPICFTTESVKTAQTGLYVSIGFMQIIMLLILKSRAQSWIYTGMRNASMNCGIAVLIIVTLLVSYCAALNNAVGTRALTFLHYGWVCLPFAALIMIFDEIRKLLIRTQKPKDKKEGSWMVRNVYW